MTGMQSSDDRRALLLRLLRDRAQELSRPQPVAYGQRGQWLLRQLAPDSGAYNVCFAARVRGRLDLDAARTALQALVDRHSALRTTFGVTDGEVAQTIAAEAELDFACETVAATDVPDLLAESAEQPFDLERGPLLRVRVFEEDGGDQILLLAAHHIVVDLWSLGVLLEDLRVLYPAAVAGVPGELAAPRSTYADFVHRQAQLVAGDEGERARRFWAEQLAGPLPVLDLPTDRPRCATPRRRGAVHRFVLDADLTGRLGALARAESATLYATLLTLFCALLHRSSGQSDLLVGSVTSGRTSPAFHDLVGYLVNPVVVRADVSGDPTVRELLAQVRDTALRVLEHEDYPFELVAQQARGEGGASQPSLFQVAFALESAAWGTQSGLSLFAGGAGDTALDLGVADMRLEPYEVPRRSAQHDLTLFMEQAGGRLWGTLEYDADLFDASTIARMAEHFARLVRGAVDRPRARVGELPMLGENDRRKVVDDCNDTARDYGPARCIHALFEEQAARTPDATALACGNERVSYRELDDRSKRLATVLRAQGAGPGIHIGLCGEGSPDMIAGLLAILHAGAAFVPLDPAYPAARLEHMVRDADLAFILAERRCVAAVPGTGTPVLCLDDPGPPAAPVSARSRDPRPDDAACVIYTSGSTGLPKGVVVEHRGIANLAAAQQEIFALGAGDRVLQFASLSFDAAVWECTMALLCGATLVLDTREARRPGRPLTDLIVGQGVTVMTLPPSALAALDPKDVPSLQTIVVAGEACGAELVRRWAPGRRFFNAYGPTEATVCATVARCSGDDGKPSIGRPIGNVRTYVLDERLEPVPVGVPGELYVGGAGVTRGYLNQPELTAARFVADPFAERSDARLYATGDRVRRLPDTSLDFLGRADDQLKIRGFRVEPGEVEAVLHRHSAVRDAVVVGRELSPGDMRLVAYVVLSEAPTRSSGAGHITSRADLRDHVAAELPSHMVPASVVFLDALPVTPNGKVDKRALPLPDRARPDLSTRHVAPRTPVEAALAEIWAEVLGVERVGVEDDFFELGGHSLLATQVASRARHALGAELPLRVLFEARTIARLAACAAPGGDPSAAPVTPVPRSGEGIELSGAQQRLWFLEQLEPGGSAYHIAGGTWLRGRLDTHALDWALTELVDRHEALRTTFAVVDGRPRQVVVPAPARVLHHVDITATAAAERDAAVRRLAEENASAPFDLTGSPLRASLVRVGAEEHVLLLAVHHIVADGWSMGVVMRELGELYAARLAGSASPLPDVELQYGDFCEWQRAWLDGDAMRDQLAYWTRTLSGAPPALELPTDAPRPERQTYRGARETRRLAPELSAQLEWLSRDAQATPFMVLLAALAMVLGRWAGQDEVVVGTPIANRNRHETEGVVGLFVNTLALRVDLGSDPSVRQLLARVRDVTLDGYAHQDVPFEKVVEALEPERSLSHTPIFQVMLNMVNLEPAPLALPGVQVERLAEDDPQTKLDLTLYAEPDPDGLLLDLVYNRDLFGRERMVELLDQLEAVLAQAAADLDRPTGQISLVTPAAGRRLPNPAAPLAPPRPWRPVHELVAEQARRRPGHPAVIAGGTPLTYADLQARADAVTAWLRERGIGTGHTVAIHAVREAGLVWAMLGVLQAGAAFTVLDADHAAPRLARCAELARPSAWLQLDSAPAPGTALADVLRYVPVRGRVDGSAIDGSAGDVRAPARAAGADTDLAYLMFTSGSTGAPKGVLGTHAPLAHFLGWYARTFAVGEDDRFSLLSGLSHDPLLRDVFGALSLGATVCIPGREQLATPERLAAWLATERITVANLTPSLGRLLAAGGDVALPALRYAFFGGESLARADVETLIRRAPHAVCVNFYGTTETPQAASAHVVEAAPAAGRIPLGAGIEGSQLLVRNGSRRAGIAELGEICVRSLHLARGYADDPSLTAARFEPGGPDAGDRVYRTGDLGRYLPDGTVAIHGRRDRQVSVRGHRVELAEVEACLRRHGAVRDAVVVAERERAGGTRLLAYVATAGAPADGAELRGFAASELPAPMVPALCVVMDELPLTANGKVDTRLLAPPLTAPPAVAPVTALERRVADVWARVLELQHVGLDDNFFDLGGHSLLVLELQTQLHAALGRELPVVELFRHPTVKRLAAFLGDGSERPTAPPRPQRAPRGRRARSGEARNRV